MRDWHLRVDTDDGERTVKFYYADENPLEETPERFEFPLENSGEYGDVTRDMVDGLDPDEEYWVIDAYDALGEFFPTVPDIPPSEGRPSNFVAVPKSAVVSVE